MANLTDPYANPYLPSFVSQRPRFNDPKPQIQVPQLNPATQSFTQIRSVNGFAGARAYVTNQLAAGASDILAESDPNTARVYIVAKDSTGQTIVEGYRLIREEEPKPVTMDDLNEKMSELLDRMNKLEEERSNAKPNNESSWQNRTAGTGTPRNQSNGRSTGQSTGSVATNDSKSS